MCPRISLSLTGEIIPGKLDFRKLYQKWMGAKNFGSRTFFSNDEGVKKAVEKWPSDMEWSIFNEGIKKLVPRLKKCIEVEEGYVEKYTYFGTYHSNLILQDLATSQGFVLAYDVSVLFAGPSYYHIPHFQATVTFIKDGRLHTFPNIQHGLAVTPEQAKDLAAEAFINAFGWALQ
ncbi:hypothetical protein AAG570_006996 [Ranatra chinensis]|uniref:Uncharacterized protein n=1 Tax=Ranatra chinensis TaxID=642074 RepID=A0ABD0YVN6_9HEMI